MYILNMKNKILEEIQPTTFSEHKLKERYDLQEWIDNDPQILGEDLLIIQKEFAGFDGTLERLDLLALDKNGHLVIIENKLDDSGRDVTWQALKYVSYCSSLSKQNIVEIYQNYLNKKALADKPNAQTAICDFLENDDFDSIILNQGYQQRIFLVAREFRPEVTSTVIWLREKNIDIRCIKVVPYLWQRDEQQEIIIDIDPIIPVPEIEQYQIKLINKEMEEKQSNTSKIAAEQLYSKYWGQLLEKCKEQQFQLFANRTTSSAHWITASSDIPKIRYAYVILSTTARVELYFDDTYENNKYYFDQLFQDKTTIETELGAELDWQRLDKKRACRICIWHDCVRDDESTWDNLINWHIDNMRNFERVFSPRLKQMKMK